MTNSREIRFLVNKIDDRYVVVNGQPFEYYHHDSGPIWTRDGEYDYGLAYEQCFRTKLADIPDSTIVSAQWFWLSLDLKESRAKPTSIDHHLIVAEMLMCSYSREADDLGLTASIR